ncbi:hypothetical protein IEQ34_018852 [Dendrobium chrysotoxum]|uniref:RING-CH-type domain-containing protein n=1 Tax=Dendrobium chrysotoxum TaxID=161865 RepID=A0AAV7G6Z0_DENCH|nr:hypothetical protein IEQ34_018852 [Dendrobium chrysotoxum]
MGDHLVLYMDRLMTTQTVGVKPAGEHLVSPTSMSTNGKGKVEKVVGEEEEPLLQLVECRICQEEDHIKNLENPCACSGSLKYAHRNCVQRWCNEKGDITCEICHENYKPGYYAPPRSSDETTIDIRQVILFDIEDWTITSAHLDLRDPSFLAIAAAQRHFLEAEYDDYATTNASGAAFCRSAALILMALLLLRHALSVSGEGDDNASAFFSVIEYCFIAPFAEGCWLSFAMLHHGLGYEHLAAEKTKAGQHYIYKLFSLNNEAAALAATEVAFILRSGQGRNLQFAIAPDSSAATQQGSDQ